MNFIKNIVISGIKVKPFISIPKGMVTTSVRTVCSLTHWRSNSPSQVKVLRHPGALSIVPRLYSQISTDNDIAEEDDGGDEQTHTRSKESNGRQEMKVVDLETSMRYMKSNAYKITYGDAKVWMPYRRNFAGPYPPKKTRKTCIRGGMLSTGNPCPLCRDEYLVIHEKNTDLLSQFIDPHTGEVISYEKTGVCQKRHKQLAIAVLKAYDQGYLEQRVPFREYDYSDYITTT